VRKLTILLAVFLTFCASAAKAQYEEIPLRPGLKIWSTSAPAAPDLIDMLSEYDNPRFAWTNSRRFVSGIKFYQSQLMIPPHPMVESNSYANLLSRNVFWIINKRLEKEIAIEVGAIKTHNCHTTFDEINRAADEIVEIALRVYEAGGMLHYLDIDTSFGVCGYNYKQAGIITARWSMLVESRLNKKLQEMKKINPYLKTVPVKFRDIEAYPFKPIEEHLAYIDKFNAERAARDYGPMDAYFLDINHKLVKDSDLVRDVNTFIYFMHDRNIKVGLIMNGEDPKSLLENNDLSYLRSANERLARFKELGLLEKIDILMVQSWAARFKEDPTESDRRDIPANVPEDAITHTNFLLHTLRCIAGTEDCGIYPAPPK